MAEHFNSETLNSKESIDNYMSEDKVCEHCGRPYSICLDACDEMWLPCTQEKCVCQSENCPFNDIWDASTDESKFGGPMPPVSATVYIMDGAGEAISVIAEIPQWGTYEGILAEYESNEETLNSSESKDNYMSESPLDESPVDEDPLTADPSDLGGPEDFSADATIDLDDGEITIHEKGAKSGGSKKLLLGVILVAGLAAAYQNSDAVLEFFEGLKGDESDPILGCMDETANNYDATATEDDGTCTYDPDDEPTA
jgi:hypothetical protein